jgi:predicted metal-binding protein
MSADSIEKYVQLAKDLGMVNNALAITPEEVFFDIRALLKCRWGCEYASGESIKCGSRETSFAERVDMVRAYGHIILVHSHDEKALSAAVLEIERKVFLDGYYFAFAIRACHLCETCTAQQGGPCPTPEKVRPCDESFGIDVYKTARNLGLPCEVLQSKEDVQNRYSFVLID